jgi:hypothetical protein
VIFAANPSKMQAFEEKRAKKRGKRLQIQKKVVPLHCLKRKASTADVKR